MDLKEAIIEAKEVTSERAIELIVRDLKITDWDGKKGKCPFHEEDSASLTWNPKANSFHCFGCGTNYDILSHNMKHYKMSYKKAVTNLFETAGTDFIYTRQEKNTGNKRYDYPKRIESDRTQVEKYLSQRGISKETLDYFDVTSNRHGNILWNYYDQDDVLTFIKARHSRPLQKHENKAIAISPKEDKDKPNVLGASSKPILYGMNKCSPSGTLHIVEGEFEVLSLHEAGVNNVVSIPFGANSFSWIEYNYEWLNLFDKIIVWMDNDRAGEKAMREIVVRLGNNRCRYIDLPLEYTPENGVTVQIKDANDVLRKLGKDYILKFLKTEKELPVEGIINLEDAEIFDPETADGLLTGIDSVDKGIIYKFFFRSVVTVTGTPGSGKSTLINQWFVAEALNQGHGVTIFSGEIMPSILRGWIEICMAGREHVKIQDNFIRKIQPEVRQKIVDWYTNKIHIIKDDDNTLETVLKRAEQTVRVNGDKIIILDNRATLSLSENDTNTYAKEKDMMNTLKAFAGKFNVLIVLVVHPRKQAAGNSADGVGGYEMGGSSHIYNLCHYNFSVRRYTEKEKKGELNPRGGGYKKGKEPIPYDTAVIFFKNRLMGKIGTVDLYFDSSYRFYTKPSELWKRYGWDTNNPNPIPRHDPNPHGVDDDTFNGEGD